MNFGPGDVLMLDQHPGDPMLCLVEGDPKFHGQPVYSKAIMPAALQSVELGRAGSKGDLRMGNGDTTRRDASSGADMSPQATSFPRSITRCAVPASKNIDFVLDMFRCR